jgi:hypothetical protein
VVHRRDRLDDLPSREGLATAARAAVAKIENL